MTTLSTEQLAALISCKIKVKPNGRAKKKKNGLMICTLKRIEGTKAYIVPSGHRREEECDVSDIVYWAKGFHQNEAHFEKHAHLFHADAARVKQIKTSKSEIQEEAPSSSKICSPKKTDCFVITNTFGELFWNKAGYFVSDLKEATVYNSLKGVRIATSLIGKRYKGDQATRWQHISRGTPLMSLTIEEAEVLQCPCRYTEKALVDPFCKEEDVFRKEKEDESISSLKEEPVSSSDSSFTENIEKNDDSKKNNDSQLFTILNEVIAARETVLQAEIALHEARIALSKCEAEYYREYHCFNHKAAYPKEIDVSMSC